MNQQNQATPKVFTTIDGNSLMAQEYEPLQFAIDKILSHGLFVFSGSPKCQLPAINRFAVKCRRKA